VLSRDPAAAVRVFVVWEPILPSDFSPPVTWVLSRAADWRVHQYWDPNHLLAKQMAADARTPQPEPDCCVDDGILWDLAAVYPKGAVWGEQIPPATVFNGPVVHVIESITAALGR
jgi:hypothetical protein